MFSMNRPGMLILQSFAAVLLAFGLLWVVLYIWDQTESGKVDYCLDAGGVWNYQQVRCEGARPGYNGP
jgi:hypothetical protein